MANVSKSVPLLAGDGDVGGDGVGAGHAGGRLVAELAGGELVPARALGLGAEHVLNLHTSLSRVTCHVSLLVPQKFPSEGS